MKNIAIIYHDADFDGKLSNEVCRFHLSKLHPDAAIHSYGWDYGRPVPEPSGLHFGANAVVHRRWDHYDSIYIVDLSVDELMARPELREKIIWIDHHKSAIEKWCIKDAPEGQQHGQFRGYRIDGVAACRLCWQWFAFARGPHGDPRIHQSDQYLPSKQDFIARKVSEPGLIRLAGEYDIWDHRDPDAKALQFGLRALDDAGFRTAAEVAFTDGHDAFILLQAYIVNGRVIKSYCDRQNDEYSAAYSQTIQWEGLTFCALNIGQRGNSDLLRGGLKLEHDAYFAWRWTGDKVLVSLYHIEGKTNHDLSKIAVKYGGGGHKGACGFRITLPELSELLTK